MPGNIFIGPKAGTLQAPPAFDKYSGVRLIVSEEVEYTSGNAKNKMLEVSCPWGTQKIADRILQQIQNYQYQPYEATGVPLDASAQLGDGVTVNDIHSGLYSIDTQYGSVSISDISAPGEEELEHEFHYESKSQREVRRRLKSVQSELSIQADRISAKVSSVGANSDKSFGWSLTDDSWTISANNTDVLKVTKSGLELTGKITAKSGEIGNFSITSKYLSFNGLTWGNDATSGVYLGERGIKLGQNFKVDLSGNLTAESGTFRGSVRAGQILYGGDDGLFNGAGLGTNSITNSKISPATISTGSLSGGINSSLGYANFANDVFNGNDVATWVKCSSMTFDTHTIARQSMTIDGQTIKFLGWI